MSVPRRLNSLVFALVAVAMAPSVLAQSIYTCVDAKGHRLTSDRPILECNDREQRELSPGGRVVRSIGPSMSPNERAAEEEKARLIAEEDKRQAETRKRDRVLLTRYPTQAAHDKERATQLATVDLIIGPASRQVAELTGQRKKLQADAAKDPVKIKAQVADNDRQLASQQRFIANQESEKQRIIVRFNAERTRLVPLWKGAEIAH